MIVRQVGIDLGTTNTLVYVPQKGVVSNEPSIVAVSSNEKKVLAVGVPAKEMVGRTPEDIVALKPLKDGVIADYYTTKAMIQYFLTKALGGFNLFKPDVIISAPAGVTSTEKRAITKAAKENGARDVFVVKEPILAALGAGIPINTASGNMIVNIGGGTSEIAVISLGGIVSWASVRVAGNKFDQAISDYIKKKHNLAIGEQMAENIKIKVGSALPLDKRLEMKVKGRDNSTGLPKYVIINSDEIALAISSQLSEIAAAIKEVFNQSPPELVADIMEKGVVLSGGGALLRSMDKYLERIIGISVFPAEDPLKCVARGTGVILEHLDTYKRTLNTKL